MLKLSIGWRKRVRIGTDVHLEVTELDEMEGIFHFTFDAPTRPRLHNGVFTLGRERKFLIGGGVVVQNCGVSPSHASLGFEGPDAIAIDREEVAVIRDALLAADFVTWTAGKDAQRRPRLVWKDTANRVDFGGLIGALEERVIEVRNNVLCWADEDAQPLTAAEALRLSGRRAEPEGDRRPRERATEPQVRIVDRSVPSTVTSVEEAPQVMSEADLRYHLLRLQLAIAPPGRPSDESAPLVWQGTSTPVNLDEIGRHVRHGLLVIHGTAAYWKRRDWSQRFTVRSFLGNNLRRATTASVGLRPTPDSRHQVAS